MELGEVTIRSHGRKSDRREEVDGDRGIHRSYTLEHRLP